MMDCAHCKNKECSEGKDCTEVKAESEEGYVGIDLESMKVSVHIESKYYMKRNRLEELILYAKDMGYTHMGIAFCIGLENEAQVIQEMLSKYFKVSSVVCKVCGIDKEKYGLDKLHGEGFEAACNPIGQALVLNNEGTDLNIILGLCMGHDILFTRHSQAPVTTLAVKDRVLAHNPLGAIYSKYHREIIRTHNPGRKYSDFYSTDFGKEILEKELMFVESELSDCGKVLSIGCGPAFLEARLTQSNPEMTVIGVDSSEEMLDAAPSIIETVVGNAEELRFNDSSFDAVLFVTSLEFIDHYERAVEEAARVLKPEGKMLALMLNPASEYFQTEYGDENSYIHRNIRHIDIEKMVASISQYFHVKSEYFLGIRDKEIFDTHDPELASLYAIKGTKT